MSEWKPKNLDEALEDAIGSALNDNSRSEDIPGASGYLLEDDFDEVVKQAIKNIKEIKGLEIKWEENNNAIKLSKI